MGGRLRLRHFLAATGLLATFLIASHHRVLRAHPPPSDSAAEPPPPPAPHRRGPSRATSRRQQALRRNGTASPSPSAAESDVRVPQSQSPVVSPQGTPGLVTASSTMRRRIQANVPEEHWGAAVAAAYHPLSDTGCDPFHVDFDNETDRRCAAHLSNMSHWQTVKPMSSILMTQRTIKFKVTLKPSGLLAILKVPQRKFVLEPASEYAAWAVDRLLRLHYVPPIAWVAVPVALLQEVVQKNGDAKYRQWLEDDLFSFVRERGLVHRGPDGVEGVPCSVQLWMYGVHDLRDTIYALPYRHLDTSWWRLFDPAQNQNLSAALTLSAHHCSDLVAFDYICDNDDRSPNKNNYAVGGCRSCRRPDKLPHPGPPEFVHLDQGSGFYHPGNGYLERNALRHANTVEYCTFRRPLLEQLRRWSSTPGSSGHRPFSDELSRRLPAGVAQLIGKASLASTQHRVNMALRQAKKCIAQHGEARVVPD